MKHMNEQDFFDELSGSDDGDKKEKAKRGKSKKLALQHEDLHSLALHNNVRYLSIG
jgi:hypothetical protein